MRYNQRPPQFNLPPLSPKVRNVLIGALALFVAELVLNLVNPSIVRSLAWQPFGNGFQWYQPFTRYLVQGAQPISFILSLLVLYFFLPMIFEKYRRGTWYPILASVVLGSIAFGMTMNLVGLLKPGAAWGWTSISTCCVALFGLIRPKAVVNLFFVLPVQASIFAWGTGLITGLLFLAAPSLGSAQHFGSWLGLMGWWYGMGPGSKARKLKGKARKIEKDLSRFTVLDGGQSDSNRDDWVN